MKQYGDAEGLSDQGWATVRVEGKDWGRVLGVGRLGGRVIACRYSRGSKTLHSTDIFCIGFCHDNALILYVYLGNDHEDTESVITVSHISGLYLLKANHEKYYVSSYSA